MEICRNGKVVIFDIFLIPCIQPVRCFYEPGFTSSQAINFSLRPSLIERREMAFTVLPRGANLHE
jgi:hypothetical protein